MANELVQSFDPNANLATLNAVIGVAMPGLIEMINRERWGAQRRSLVSLAACIAVGVLTTWFGGDLTKAGDLSSALLGVFGAAIITYNQWWKPSGNAQAIRGAVNPGAPAEPAEQVVVSGTDLSVDAEPPVAGDGS